MKKVLTLVAFLLSGIPVMAQTPEPPVQHFVISGSMAGFNGNQTVSIGSAGFQLTKNVSLAYEFISNPSDSSKPRIGSGVANYTRIVSDLVPAKLKSKLVIDLSNYVVTFQAGAGKESLAGANVGDPRTSHVVGNFGIYAGRPLPGGHTILGAGYKFIVGPSFTTIKVPTGNLIFTF